MDQLDIKQWKAMVKRLLLEGTYEPLIEAATQWALNAWESGDIDDELVAWLQVEERLELKALAARTPTQE